MQGDPAQPAAVVETLDGALADLSGANYNEWVFARAMRLLGRRILDVGAGIGTFTELAAEAGREVTAVEPESLFAEALRRRFAGNARVTVVEGTIDAVEGTFDSAISFNVLEHIADDAGVIRSCAARLVPDGRFFVLVPAHERLFGGYDRAAGHLRRYSAGRLRRLLDDAGLEVETLRHVNPVGALGWAVRVATTSSEEWPSASFALFDHLVPVLRRFDWLPLPFGLSLWAVARKPISSV